MANRTVLFAIGLAVAGTVIGRLVLGETSVGELRGRVNAFSPQRRV